MKISTVQWLAIILFSFTLTHKVSSLLLIACRLGVIVLWMIQDRFIIYKDEYYKIYRMFIIPKIVLFAYTLFLCLLGFINGADVYLGAAISEIVQQCVFLLTGLAFFNISRENAVKNTFIAVVFNYSVTLVIALRDLGLSGLLSYLRSPGTALSSVTTYFEIHGLMFALGILLIYFALFESRKEKHHYIKILVCLFFIYCGYKRIEFVAIALAVVLFALLRNKKNRWLYLGGVYRLP